MWNLVREAVSGRKSRFKEDGYNLDLTYVCPRIVAMAYPASGLESTYRNNINDVSGLIKKNHGKNYKVFNLSGRTYDYSKFDHKVVEFQWEDHHSPPICTLFESCQIIDDFLSSNINNIVAVHCLAGKGRTGTLICCYFLFCGRFSTPEEALGYYAKKRFRQGLGVTQPSQIRYVNYFYKLLNDWRMTPTLKILDSLVFYGIPKCNGNGGCKPILEVIQVRENLQKIYNDKTSHSQQEDFFEKQEDSIKPRTIENIPCFVKKIQKTLPVYGDILMRVKNNGRYQDSKLFRFSFNTAFIENNLLRLKLDELDPFEVIKDTRFPDFFLIELRFSDFCKCSNKIPFDLKCSFCIQELIKEKPDWEKVYELMNKYIKRDKVSSSKMLFGDPKEDEVDKILDEFRLEGKDFKIEPQPPKQKKNESEQNDLIISELKAEGEADDEERKKDY